MKSKIDSDIRFWSALTFIYGAFISLFVIGACHIYAQGGVAEVVVCSLELTEDDRMIVTHGDVSKLDGHILTVLLMKASMQNKRWQGLPAELTITQVQDFSGKIIEEDWE